MLPDRVSNPGPLTYESGALPIALRGPAKEIVEKPGSQHMVKISRRRKQIVSTNMSGSVFCRIRRVK